MDKLDEILKNIKVDLIIESDDTRTKIVRIDINGNWIKEAHRAILKWVEGVLPEEEKESSVIENMRYGDDSAGFNRCLSEIKARLK